MIEYDGIAGYDIAAPLAPQPPCPSPAKPSALTPRAGSCIGVLYQCDNPITDKNKGFCNNKCGTKIHCVHNGRLVDSGKDFILVNHYTLDKYRNPKEETRIFYRSKIPKVIIYVVTPDLPKSFLQNCTGNKISNPSGISTSDCVGIYYSPSGKANDRDIKNGRFAFWTDINGAIHCTLTNNDISKIYRVYYYHYAAPGCVSGRPDISAELNCRERVLGVFKLSQNNLGGTAKC